MKAARSRTVKSYVDPQTGGCLLRHANFVSESKSASFEEGEPTWKAGTLPAELLPQNRIYFGRWSLPFCEKKRPSRHLPFTSRRFSISLFSTIPQHPPSENRAASGPTEQPQRLS